ncbi:hypothetical protein PoB_007034100 [Plakobranchus ocellatus]|uniref:Uncharacterized protein n=1 Tax=Plakobranchus ocellatus TaxID=259542 RepID=A0AAV4DI53_9GAST|nr:hypothetical protein PoB_007034100 [Plakobranchus ocellatus]
MLRMIFCYNLTPKRVYQVHRCWLLTIARQRRRTVSGRLFISAGQTHYQARLGGSKAAGADREQLAEWTLAEAHSRFSSEAIIALVISVKHGHFRRLGLYGSDTDNGQL